MKESVLKNMMKFMKRFGPFYIKKGKLNKQIEAKDKIIVIFGHPACSGCQNIMLKFPGLFIRGWIKGYTVRFCNVLEHPIDSKKLGIVETPTLLIKKNGNNILYVCEEKIINGMKKI